MSAGLNSHDALLRCQDSQSSAPFLFPVLLVQSPWIPLAPFPYPEFPVLDATSSPPAAPRLLTPGGSQVASPPAAPSPLFSSGAQGASLSPCYCGAGMNPTHLHSPSRSSWPPAVASSCCWTTSSGRTELICMLRRCTSVAVFVDCALCSPCLCAENRPVIDQISENRTV
jgi:hypothetical protein